jgi:hypothetical protein
MLSVPTSLLQRWSDYRAATPCVEALLTACLDEAPALVRARLDLEAIHARGWRSEPARAQCIACCDDLVRRCIERRRYIHNVAVQQDFELFFDHALAALPPVSGTAGRPAARPHPLAAFAARFRGSDAGPDAGPIGGDRPWQRRLYEDLPCWSMVVRDLDDGELVLIDAPLAARHDEGDGCTFFLCDYPPLLRQPSDVRVPLRVSPDAAGPLARMPGVCAGWHPFCRLLALVRQEAGGIVLQALQFHFRLPVPDRHRYRHEPVWPESLLEEAVAVQHKLMEVDWLKKALGTDPAPGVVEDVRQRLRLFASGTDRALTRGAGSPYEGVEALWCCLATVLPVWSEDFPLTAGQVGRLLEAFDASFTDDWRRTASRLLQAVELRYTPARMDAVRGALAALAHGGAG